VSLEDARLYLCTPDREDLAFFIEECVAGGVDVVQLRESHLQGTALAERARLAQRVCSGLGVPFILNDDPALSLEVGADGAHVGQDDMAPDKARQLLGPGRLLGLSTHALDELEKGLKEPVDYVSVGPVVPTPTKPGRPGTGLQYVSAARRLIEEKRPGLPFFVTGNARPETVGEIVAAGATKVVVVRYLTEAIKPRQAARRLRGALEEALGLKT
jgi:thiamine-phosphate pyrophosphorylase